MILASMLLRRQPYIYLYMIATKVQNTKEKYLFYKKYAVSSIICICNPVLYDN